MAVVKVGHGKLGQKKTRVKRVFYFDAINAYLRFP